MTGPRKGEIASLTPVSFNLDANPPTITVDAADSKHRRKDVLPLHPELVAMLRDWLKGMKPTDRLFPRLAGKKTWVMVKNDLERAGIPYRNHAGIADFHAAGRHTHITELLRNGASIPEAQKLARHSDVKMTMRYTHIGIDDQARALAALPAPKPASSAAPAQDGALQMRCISRDSGRHSSSPCDTDDAFLKRQNPCQGKGFDTDCRHLSPSGKSGGGGNRTRVHISRSYNPEECYGNRSGNLGPNLSP